MINQNLKLLNFETTILDEQEKAATFNKEIHSQGEGAYSAPGFRYRRAAEANPRTI